MYFTTQRSKIGPLGFFVDRVCRIVPIYWLMTLAVFGLAAIAPALFNSTEADATQLLKSLFFIPFMKRSGLIQPVLFVGWTLNYEMFFYALFALGLAARARLLLTTGVLVALVATGLFGHSNNVFFRFYTDSRVLEFAFGMWIGALQQPVNRIPRLPLAMAAAIGLLVAVGAPVAFPTLPPILASGVASAVLVWSVVRLEAAGAIVDWKWAVALGNASYALYLVHPFVTDAFIKVQGRLPGGAMTAAPAILVALAAAAGVAVLVSRFVEVPLTRAARRQLSAQRLRPAGAVASP
jgi:peptidoglycan/LPS O-acetylase OafA/YrhL